MIGMPNWRPRSDHHDTDLAADQSGGRQERLVLTSHLDAAAMVSDRLPALPVRGTLPQTDLVLAVEGVSPASVRIGWSWQVVKASVLSQAADDHDVQTEYGEKKRTRGIGTIDRQPDLRLHPQLADRLHEPSQQLHAELMLGAEFPGILFRELRDVDLADVQHRSAAETEFDTLFIYNFFPDEGLERLLGLVQSLQHKIRQIDDVVGLDASVLGEAINPKVFNTIKRIEQQDETVIDEEEAEAELASDEGLIRHLAEFIKASGTHVLSDLPDGIHSGKHGRGHRGVFLYFQRRGETSANTDHYWRYYDTATGDIEDNRLAIADLIRCKLDEPRLIDPDLKSDIHSVMQVVEQSILDSAQKQEIIQAAPKELSGDQSAVLVALQQALGRPGIDRARVLNLLTALSQPLLSAG